jgi:CelD/BcsL family acetyltransferase involved in cellulose biosynthesis
MTSKLGEKWRRSPRRVALSGIPERYIAAAGEGPYRASIRVTRPAPFVDLAALRLAGRPYLSRLSANTRYQLRRSQRRYEADGPLTICRARSVAEAGEFLDRLAELHQRYWTGRGRPGAFANAKFGRFHRALIERAFPEGEIDLLRICGGGRVVGYLYNFLYRRVVYAYQSGFDYAVSDSHQKPGLTCHHLAIERYLAAGADRYDFLAGADRYKQSLASGATLLHWIEINRPVAAFSMIGRQWLRRLCPVGAAPGPSAGLPQP